MNSENKKLTTAFDAMSKGKKFPITLMTVLLCIGVCIAYSHNTTPAPFFSVLFDFFGMSPTKDQAALNLSLSIIYPFVIICTFIGTALEQKLGTRKLFSLFMTMITLGTLMNLISDTYTLFLAGRVVYAIGFGLSIPTMGSAIMRWYRPKARSLMTALNGIFPLLGALLCFGTFAPVATAAGGGDMGIGWQIGAAYTGFITLFILIVWLVFTGKDIDSINYAAAEAEVLDVHEDTSEKSIFGWLLKKREIKSIMITFFCDFTMYAYIATILPLWLMKAGGMNEVAANVWAAIAFPAFGVIGVAVGAAITTKTGKRKPVIIVCQMIKLVGLMIASLLADVSVIYILIGISLFGLGNGGWMSPMFLIPTELSGTNSTRVAGGFSLFLSFGYIAGFIMPIVGGMIAGDLIASSGITDETAQLAYGYKWSMFILSLSHIIAVISAFTLRETGPGSKKKFAGTAANS